MAKMTNKTGEDKRLGDGIGIVANEATIPVPDHVARDMQGMPGWEVELSLPEVKTTVGSDTKGGK